MKVISYIDKFVFQDFRQDFSKQKNESIHSSDFPDSFQFPGKIASNIFQILILDYTVYFGTLSYTSYTLYISSCKTANLIVCAEDSVLESYRIPGCDTVQFAYNVLSSWMKALSTVQERIIAICGRLCCGAVRGGEVAGERVFGPATKGKSKETKYARWPLPANAVNKTSHYLIASDASKKDRKLRNIFRSRVPFLTSETR